MADVLIDPTNTPKEMDALSRKKMVLGLILVLCLATLVVAAVNLMPIKSSAVNVNSFIHRSKAVQDAERAAVVAQKTKIRKQVASGKVKSKDKSVDPAKAPALLTELDRKKMDQYKVINGALVLQGEVYNEMAANDGVSGKASELKGEIPKAKEALGTLKKLTEQQVKIYKATTGDAQAIKVAWSTFYTWEAAVGALSDQPLDDAAIARAESKIGTESSAGISAAEAQLKSIDKNDLDAADQDLLRNEILPSGQDVFSGLQGVMDQMQTIIQEFTKQLQGGSGSSNPLQAMGSLLGGKKSGDSGKPAFDPAALQSLQGTFQTLAGQLQGFMGSFGSFMQVAGGLVGETVSVPSVTMPVLK